MEDICKERYTQLESQLEEQRESILQGQNNYNAFVEQQQLKEQQQDLILKQYGEQIRQGEQITQELLNQQKQEIQQLKEIMSMHLQQSPKSCARPDLEEISRKNLLTPKAKKLYKRTVQLKKEKRRLKRRLKQIASKTLSQRKRNKKNQIDQTATVRQQFVNMILRNNNVASQV